MADDRSFAAAAAGQIAETIDRRGALYGSAETNFGRVAEAWRMWLRWRHGVDVPLTPMDAGVMQSLIKLSRQAATPGHADSALDGAAYWLLAVGCEPRDPPGDNPP